MKNLIWETTKNLKIGALGILSPFPFVTLEGQGQALKMSLKVYRKAKKLKLIIKQIKILN